MGCEYRILKQKCTRHACSLINSICQFETEEYQGEHCPIYVHAPRPNPKQDESKDQAD